VNIVILTQLFETPQDNGSDRQYFFAREMVERGNEVKIITSNIDYKLGCKRFNEKGKIFKNYKSNI
jgi:hypothetical protein